MIQIWTVSRDCGWQAWTWTNTANYIPWLLRIVHEYSCCGRTKYSWWKWVHSKNNCMPLEDADHMTLTEADERWWQNRNGLGSLCLVRWDYNYAETDICWFATIAFNQTSCLTRYNSVFPLFQAYENLWRASSQKTREWQQDQKEVQDLQLPSKQVLGSMGHYQICFNHTTYGYNLGNGSYGIWMEVTNNGEGITALIVVIKSAEMGTTTCDEPWYRLKYVQQCLNLSFGLLLEKQKICFTVPPTLAVAGEKCIHEYEYWWYEERHCASNILLFNLRWATGNGMALWAYPITRNEVVNWMILSTIGGDTWLIEGQPMGVYMICMWRYILWPRGWSV